MVSSAVKPRMVWMDALRGVAIALVILWHSAAILLLYSYEVPAWLIFVNELFAPYRMPILMFLSGMLLPASLRKPLPVYLIGKLRFVAYPLVIWTVIHFFLYQPDTTLLDLNFWSTSYLWFLFYIFIYYVGAPLVKWIPSWVIVFVALGATFLIDDDNRRRFFFLAIFFFLGKVVAEHRAIFDRILASRWLWALAPVAVGFGIVSAVFGPYRYIGALAIFSLAGILVAAKTAMVLTERVSLAPLRYVGRHSLIYYVTHFPTIILVVLAGERLLGLPIGIVIPLGFAAAIAVGSVFAWLAERTPARWLFIAPARGDLERFSAKRLPPTVRLVA